MNDAFAGKCRIAVNQNHHAVLPHRIGIAILTGPHSPNGNRIDKLQVAGVKAECQMDISAIGCPVVSGMAKMILDVPPADVQFWIEIGKLPKNSLRAFTHDIRQHIEPAAVRHPHDNVADFLRCTAFDRHLQERNETLGAFQGETFCTQKSLLNELLEDCRGRHLAIDSQLLAAVELNPIFTTLHSYLQPLPYP